MNRQPSMPPIEDDEAERLALAAAIAEARADPRPAVPHDMVLAEMLDDIARAERCISELSERARKQA